MVNAFFKKKIQNKRQEAQLLISLVNAHCIGEMSQEACDGLTFPKDLPSCQRSLGNWIP